VASQKGLSFMDLVVSHSFLFVLEYVNFAGLGKQRAAVCAKCTWLLTEVFTSVMTKYRPKWNKVDGFLAIINNGRSLLFYDANGIEIIWRRIVG
jgi:hypothetical protein